MNFTRKKFLQTLAVFGIAVVAQKLKSEEQTVKKDPALNRENQSIAIIGGGLSGLYSAYLLDKVGYKTTIIEAGDRFGGRIFSNFQDSIFVGEFGGEWISTRHENILSLIKELDLETVSHNAQKEIIFGSDQKPHSFTKDSKDLLKKVQGLHRKMSPKQKQGLDRTDVFHYLKYQGLKDEDLLFLDMKFKTKYGESIRNLSTNKFLSDLNQFEFVPETVLRVRGGNSSIIKKLVSRLERTEKILGDPVIEIDQSSKNVKIKTKSGRLIESDSCIVAIAPALFSEIKWTPELPKEKKIGSVLVKNGRVAKVLIQAKEKNLADGDTYYLNAPIQKIYSSESDSKEVHLLNGLSVGDSSEFFSEKNEDYAKELIALSLKKYSMEESFEMEKIAVKIWQNEPYIRGGFSIFPPGSFDARENLQKSFNRVFFAGESLVKDNGSMNSAVVSAIQAINQI